MMLRELKCFIWTPMSLISHSKDYHWTSLPTLSQSKSYYWTSMPIISQSEKILYVLKHPAGAFVPEKNMSGI